MNSIYSIISEETIYALSWTGIHSIWQGLFIAIVVGLMAHLSQQRSAQFRYLLWLGSMLAFVASCIYTFLRLNPAAKTPESFSTMVPMNVHNDSKYLSHQIANIDVTWTEAFIEFLNANTSYVVLIWLIGFVVLSLRMIGSFYFLSKLRSTATYNIGNHWQSKVNEIMDKIGSSKYVEIAESAITKTPIMIGSLKPMILFPIGILNQMRPEEVEAILAHEISHVLRNDFIINIIQNIIETIFYFNPAIWLISSKIRMERENCCDDMAIDITASNVNYAKALLCIGHLQKKQVGLALQFGNKQQKLLSRVKRILNQKQHKTSSMEKIITSTLLLSLIVMISMGASNFDTPTKGEDFIRSHALTHQIAEASNHNLIPIESLTTWADSRENEFIPLDTLPGKKKSTCQMMWYQDGQRIDMVLEEGKMEKLWIDGERIAEEDFDKYKDFINAASAIPPPPPPAPPGVVPPAPPSIPAPPIEKERIGQIYDAPRPALPNEPGYHFNDANKEPFGFGHENGTTQKKFYHLESDGNTTRWVLKDGQFDMSEEDIDGYLQQFLDKQNLDSDVLDHLGNDFNFRAYTQLNDKDDLPAFLMDTLIVDKLTGNSIWISKEKENFPFEFDSESEKFMHKFHMNDQENGISKIIELQMENQEELEELLSKIAKDGDDAWIKIMESQDDAGWAKIFENRDDGFAQIHEFEFPTHEFEFPNHEFHPISEIIGNGFEIHSFSGETSEISMLRKRIFEELKNDGLINSLDEYDIKLTDRFLKVDGRKVNENQYKKYRKIYEKVLKTNMVKGSRFILVKKNGNNKSSLTIS